MAAPKGNKFARKAKDWENALRWALDNFSSETVPSGTALREIAKTCVSQALIGDKDARAEIANRLDGKPHEYLEARFTHTLAQELSDAELANIATGSSEGAAEAQTGQEGPAGLH